MVRQCVAVGLVRGEHLSVDGSFVEANAAKADIGVNAYSPALKQPFWDIAAVLLRSHQTEGHSSRWRCGWVR